jgi:hypothetical protein
MLLLCEAKSPGLFRLRPPIVAALPRGGEECGKKVAKFDFSFVGTEVSWSETSFYLTPAGRADARIEPYRFPQSSCRGELI